MVKKYNLPQNVRSEKSGKSKVFENYWSQQVGHIPVHNGTEPGLLKNECPLSACNIRRICCIESSCHLEKRLSSVIKSSICLECDRWNVS